MSPAWVALSEALVAFVPQGLAIGALTALMAGAAPTARVRHGIEWLGLLACPAVVLWTWLDAPAGTVGAPGASPSWVPFVLTAWALGAGALSLRLLGGWARLARLRRQVRPLEAAAQARLRAIAERVGCHPSVRLVEAAWADGPLTLGWLRPLVVVPVGFFLGLPPACADALLAHELAHVARRDYLLNLFQRLIEALLFFHPVVWWLSRRLTQSRELCCDDRVVARFGHRHDYVRGLAQLAALRASAVPAPAAHGGQIVSRIRRLVHPPVPRRAGGPLVLAALALLALPALAGPSSATVDIAWLPPAVAQHAPHFEAAGARHGVDPRLLAIVTLVESKGRPKAISRLGSRGLMQIMPATGSDIATRRGLEGHADARLYEPAYNVDLGAWYLKQQLDQFGDVALAAAAYNGGPDHVRAWLDGKTALRPETRRYMKRVSALWSARASAERPHR